MASKTHSLVRVYEHWDCREGFAVADILIPRKGDVYNRDAVRPLLLPCLRRLFAERINYLQLDSDEDGLLLGELLGSSVIGARFRNGYGEIDDLVELQDDRATLFGRDAASRERIFEPFPVPILFDIPTAFPLPSGCEVIAKGDREVVSQVKTTSPSLAFAIPKLVERCVELVLQKTLARGGWAVVGECTNLEPFGGFETLE